METGIAGEPILTTLIRSLGWQGGTIGQVMESLPDKKDCNTMAYTFGFTRGQLKDRGVGFHAYTIPFKSWDDNAKCNLSYARGLLDALNKG